MEMKNYLPKMILLFCGKRKSGKDYLTEQLLEMLNKISPKSAVIIRLSGPLKKCYAQNHGLNYNELLSASDYKEKHRLNMITWSEAIRNKDYGYFCRAALELYEAESYPIWIISDCRRKTDFQFFEETFSDICRRIRVNASENTRIKRGFVFQEGVDNAESECGLDDITDFNHIIENEGTLSAEQLLFPLLDEIKNL